MGRGILKKIVGLFVLDERFIAPFWVEICSFFLFLYIKYCTIACKIA